LNPLVVSRLHRFTFAATIVIAAALLRFAADPWLGRAAPYLLFYPAVMVAATYGGFWPGILATLLSAAIAVFVYLAPVHSFWVMATGDMVGLVLFVANGTLISRLSEIARRGRISEQQLAAIVQSSDDAIVGKDLDGLITSWNRGAERIFGYSPAEVIGRPITVIIPPERLDEEAHTLKRIRAGERLPPFETTRRSKDGAEIDVSITISPIRNAAGVVVGASKIARDITQRRREERLREELIERERVAREEAVAARDRLAFLAEVGAVVSSSLDYAETLDRAVHFALPRLGDYCNVLIEDEHGRIRHVAWGHVDRKKEDALHALALRLIEGGEPSKITFATAIMKSGKSIVVSHDVMAKAALDVTTLDPQLVRLGQALMPYAYVGVPLFVRGRVVGVMAFGTTEQESRREYTSTDVVMVEEFARRVSLAVENARLFRQAGELNRLKDEFLATVSHELRTPLSAVLGWSRMLANGQLDAAKATRAAHAIERNALAQAKLVDDILDVARGLTGNLRLEMKTLDLTAIAHQAVETIAPAAAAKGIDVHVRPRTPTEVVGDSGRLKQVVWNLLSNAVKFTPAGGRVTIDITQEAGSVELHVADTGTGISATFLPFVFDKFRQGDGSYTRQYGGLGLGLSIARHLIELHGGSIEAQSDGAGAGATFVMRLPLPARDAESAGRVD
jgi:PAS domain S-box-containing protein